VLGGTPRLCFSNNTDLKKKKGKKNFSRQRPHILYFTSDCTYGTWKWYHKKWKKFVSVPNFYPVGVQYLKVCYDGNLAKLAFRTVLSWKKKVEEKKNRFCTQHLSSWWRVLGGTPRLCFSNNTDLKKKKKGKKKASLDNALTFYILRRIVLTELESGITKNEKSSFPYPTFIQWVYSTWKYATTEISQSLRFERYWVEIKNRGKKKSFLYPAFIQLMKSAWGYAKTLLFEQNWFEKKKKRKKKLL